MEKKIKWNEGDGYIVTIQGGSGDASLPFSSIANEGIDRERIVNVVSKEGIACNVNVKQIGLREVFTTSDSGAFVCSDGGTFNVLKDGV